MKIYLASSWRNPFQREVLLALRDAGHQVYDFRNPAPGEKGFAWSDVDPGWRAWDAERFRTGLNSYTAAEGFANDMTALEECDVCVLLLPSGRSAHIEAGWAKGAGKRLYILMLGGNEPELMYRMADAICVSVPELIDALDSDRDLHATYAYTVPPGEQQCRECGCWEGHACPGGCYWVEEDLCSACKEVRDAIAAALAEEAGRATESQLETDALTCATIGEVLG